MLKHLLCIMLIGLLAYAIGCTPEPYQATAPPREGEILLIVRVDDVGLLHSTNLAAQSLFENSIATDYSIAVTTPWFSEAAAAFRQHPELSVGLQLTVTSPWKNYKWGPVSPSTTLATFLDPVGNFWPTYDRALNSPTDSLALISEFRAQVQQALAAGLDIAYLHFPVQGGQVPRWVWNILEHLAWEYQVGITTYLDETPTEPISGKNAREIEKSLVGILNSLKPGLWVLETEAGERTPELYGAGFADTTEISYRANVMQALRSNIVAALCAERGIKLVSYGKLLQDAGLWHHKPASKTASTQDRVLLEQ